MMAWFESQLGISWLAPHRVWLLLLIPVALLGRAFRRPSACRVAMDPWLRGAAAPAGAPLDPLPPLPRSWRVLAQPLPLVLDVCGIVGCCLALAQPAVQVPLPRRSAGIDVLLALDLSSSMGATDLIGGQSRLDAAIAAAEAFVAVRPDDRIGLLTFARYPELAAPLTTDHEALTAMLRRLEPVAAEGPEDATGIGGAVARGGALLSGATSASKVLILLTDGEENVATAATPREIAPLHGAQLCREFGVRVHTIVLTPDARPSPGIAALQRVAELTEGRCHAASDAASLQAAYAAIDTLERSAYEEVRHVTVEQYPVWVAVSLALLVLGALVGRILGSVRP